MFTPEFVPSPATKTHARRLAKLGIRLNLDGGPILYGGCLTRAESGESAGKDADLVFFDAASMEAANAALLKAGFQVLRHNPRSGTAVLGNDSGIAYDLIPFFGGTFQRLLAKTDIRACGLVSDGVRGFALVGAMEDAEARCITLLRQTDPRRLQAYLQRGWLCHALDLREFDIALNGEAIDGLTSHDLTPEQRYGHEPLPVRGKDRVPRV